MSVEEAIALGKRAIMHAVHRDAYSGGINNVYLVTEKGWEKIWAGDTMDTFFHFYPVNQVMKTIKEDGENTDAMEA
jgi:20S proteasome subunit beta 5